MDGLWIIRNKYVFNYKIMPYHLGKTHGLYRDKSTYRENLLTLVATKTNREE